MYDHDSNVVVLEGFEGGKGKTVAMPRMYAQDFNVVVVGALNTGKTVAIPRVFEQMTKPDWGDKGTDGDALYFGLAAEGDKKGSDIARLLAKKRKMIEEIERELSEEEE